MTSSARGLLPDIPYRPERSNGGNDEPSFDTRRRLRLRRLAFQRDERAASGWNVPLHDMPARARLGVWRVCDIRPRRRAVFRPDADLAKLRRRAAAFLPGLRVGCLYGIWRYRRNRP